MPKGLSQKKLDKLFACYCEKQSVNNVAKVCKVSHTTVKKYKILLDWDSRIKDVQAKAIEKGNISLADSIAKNLTYVEFIKGKLVELLVNEKNIFKSTNVVNDLDKAIRLELLLRGEADSRMELKDDKFKNISTKQLLKLRKDLENADTAGSK